MSKFFPLIISILFIVSSSTFAQKVVEPTGPEDWSKPYPAFRIVGNVYYVGTYDLACYLITSNKGSILINTGLASSAESIKTSVESLGFRMSDIKILLVTQAHYDHTGAIAAIKKSTGAQLMVNGKDAGVMEDGGKSDYAFGKDVSNFEPVKVDKVLHNGDTIRLGDVRLVILDHPGHTKGSSSYMLTADSYRVLVANMPSIVISKKFSEMSSYPHIADDYRHTLASLKDLKFDIWLSSHAVQFNLHSKHKPGDPYNPAAFKDQKGYDEAVKKLKAEFDKKVLE